MNAVAQLQPSTWDGASVVLIHHNNVKDLRHGDVAFLAPEGFTGEGIYSVPFDGRHVGDIRRVHHCGLNRWRMAVDDDRFTVDELTLDELRGMGLCRVVGAASAFTNDFQDFLVGELRRILP